jgi:hypothetical protein
LVFDVNTRTHWLQPRQQILQIRSSASISRAGVESSSDPQYREGQKVLVAVADYPRHTMAATPNSLA